MTGTAYLAISFMLAPVSAYQSVPEQTDDSPYITSIGQTVHPFGIAVSQDLLASGEVCYGDTVIVEGLGNKVVNDTMNKRHKKHFDIWVENLDQEKAVGYKKRNVMIIKSLTRFCSKSETLQ